MPDVDRTNEFHELVTKARHAAAKLDEFEGRPLNKLKFQAESQLFSRRHKPSQFSQAALHLLEGIRSTRQFLLSQQSDYLNLHKHLSSASSSMTEQERDRLEDECSRFVALCATNIEQLKAAIGKQQMKSAQPKRRQRHKEEEKKSIEEDEEEKEMNSDTLAHQHSVVISLYQSLQELTESIQKLRIQRTKQIQQKQQRTKPPAFTPHISQHHVQQVNQLISTPSSSSSSSFSSSSSSLSSSSVASSSLSTSESASTSTPAFSQQEMQMLEEENKDLLDLLEDDLDQMQRAEQRLGEISQLMSLFSTKVVEQEEQINLIHEHAINSVMHLKKGNESLRSASRRGVSFRLIVMFVLLVASFSLLFLDWFMD